MSIDDYQKLMPLNKYGYSKKFLDDWAFKQEKTPNQWIHVKFFNVYGPQEYHKERMASMVYHTFNQYSENGKVKIRAKENNLNINGEDVIEFVPMPEDLRGKYQYFTEATMQKLNRAGYSKPFYTLEEGIKDYVKYLSAEDSYL